MQHRDCLPHLRQSNVIYFGTFRLADSLPQARLHDSRRQRDDWLERNPPPHSPTQQAAFRQVWTAPIERLLDSGCGDYVPGGADCRRALEETLRHDDSRSYELGDFVIMPNHVHLLVRVLPGHQLSTAVEAWKSISARRVNRLRGRRGSLWQPEYFDHIVRDGEHWERFARYIRQNPRHLPAERYTLGCGALGRPDCVSPESKTAEGDVATS